MREGSRASLPSPPLLYIAFFTSLRSPLSERLEQATQPRQDSYKRKTWKLKTETNGCEGKMIYFILLHRHECFTGKYTSRKIHKNYIRDPNGVFSIISHVSLSIT